MMKTFSLFICQVKNNGYSFNGFSADIDSGEIIIDESNLNQFKELVSFAYARTSVINELINSEVEAEDKVTFKFNDKSLQLAGKVTSFDGESDNQEYLKTTDYFIHLPYQSLKLLNELSN